MSASRASFLDAMAAVPAAVHLVTTDGSGGRGGLTVASMCSVSADPPTVLVCINRDTPGLLPLLENGCFAVNLLGASQASIADVFAGREDVTDGERFLVGEWSKGDNGCPLLVGCVATLECELVDRTPQGSHDVLFGRVTAANGNAEQLPLLYWRRVYGAPEGPR